MYYSTSGLSFILRSAPKRSSLVKTLLPYSYLQYLTILTCTQHGTMQHTVNLRHTATHCGTQHDTLQQRSHAFTDVASVTVAGSVAVSSRSRQATRRHTRQPQFNGQARKRSQLCMFLSSACIATHPTSCHRRRRQHDRLHISSAHGSTILANAVLYGISSKNINRLQRIQNARARCVDDSKLHRGSNAATLAS